MQRGLCFFQWALWQSLPQYLTRPQRAQLGILDMIRSQFAQEPALTREGGFLLFAVPIAKIILPDSR